MVSDLIVARPNVQVTVYGEVTLLDAPHPKPNLSRMKRTRVAVYTRDEWTCQGCDRTAIDQPADVLSGRYAPMLPDGEWLELDHIIPRALGGPYVAENLQALCTTCNREKWASTERVNWEGRIRRAIQIMQRQSWNEATARRAVDILLGGDRREGIG